MTKEAHDHFVQCAEDAGEGENRAAEEGPFKSVQDKRLCIPSYKTQRVFQEDTSIRGWK